MKPAFIIFMETLAGETIRAFTWCRDKDSGIERARKEAPEFGHNAVRIWAEPIGE